MKFMVKDTNIVTGEIFNAVIQNCAGFNSSTLKAQLSKLPAAYDGRDKNRRGESNPCSDSFQTESYCNVLSVVQRKFECNVEFRVLG